MTPARRSLSTPAFDDRCRCPHPDHAGMCGERAAIACETCGVRLCASCAETHHHATNRVRHPVVAAVVAIVALAIAAISPAPASADDAALSRHVPGAIETLADPSVELPIFEEIAAGVFGERVDCHLSGGILFHWHAAPGHEYAVATADLGGCDLWLNPRYWLRRSWRRKCDTFVHEYGHLLGRPHTSDRTVMDPLRVRIVKPCRVKPFE